MNIEYHVANKEDMPQVYSLRRQVFVDEQNVPEDMEIDEFDEGATHIMAKKGNLLVGTGRLVVNSGDGIIGRMAVKKSCRHMGIGKQMMLELEKQAQEMRLRELHLHAQVYAQGFYELLGYEPRGGIFDEAGIDHIEMFKSLL